MLSMILCALGFHNWKLSMVSGFKRCVRCNTIKRNIRF